MNKNIHWLGHDTFRIEAEKVIYTDPFQIAKGKRADLILITHEHRDHCSPEDIDKVAGPDTIIVGPPDCSEKVGDRLRPIRAGEAIDLIGIKVEAVPAYNTNKQFHTKDRGWIGYIFTAGGKRIYLAGDTDRIPEMKQFRADIALLPVSGTYVMTADEAAGAALDIKPEVAIPMHYGSIVGSADDAERFAEALKGKISVEIKKKES